MINSGFHYPELFKCFYLQELTYLWKLILPRQELRLKYPSLML